MYITSPRCVARIRNRYGAQHSNPRTCRRFLTSRSTRLTPARTRTWPPQLGFAVTLPPECNRQRNRRYIAVSKAETPRNIAVLGGGLTGLTTAWYLARELPKAKITIYDAGKRMGGWIDTVREEVETPDGRRGTVHFERAARMIKPQAGGRIAKWDDLVFYDLVTKLNLTGQLMCAKKDEEKVAGFLYYPDHLVGIPKLYLKPFQDLLGTLLSLLKLVPTLTEPVFRDMIPAVVNMLAHKNNPYRMDMFKGRKDMSMGDYVAYMCGGSGFVDKVLSALVHGVSGGDVWNTSMGSGIMADLLVPLDDLPISQTRVRMADYELMTQLVGNKAVFDLASEHLDSSALWFRDGFRTLTDALAGALRANPNVTIKLNEPVTKVSYVESLDRVSVSTKNGNQRYDKVVSTIFAKHLHAIATPELPSLESSEAVTIMLVNLWYPVPHVNFPHNGFGYLIPQATPFSQNPECLLGVIFDSDREFPLPTPSTPQPPNRGADTLPGTKLTVMMGGHYWSSLPRTSLPTPAEAISQAKTAVARHLNLPPELTATAHATAKLCADCIPQHVVGHAARMRAAHGELEWGFKGRLAVAGQSYQNPGVLGMLRAGRDVAMQIAGRQVIRRGGDGENGVEGAVEAAPWTVGETGLERFTRQPVYRAVEKAMLPLRFGSGAFVDESGRIVPRGGGGPGGEGGVR